MSALDCMLNFSGHNHGLKKTRDETDNFTRDQLTFVPKLTNTMNEIFHREDERLKTFDRWPLPWLDKKELAMTGMFFTGDGDKVKCYFCEVEIGCWEQNDTPLGEHLRWSVNCPLLRRRTTNNIPMDPEALNSVLPPPSYDVCGASDSMEVRQNAFPEGTIPSGSMVNGVSDNSGSSHNVCAYYPEFPEYAVETARERSFAEWPKKMKQKPPQLAEAGFFYVGIGDRVKCFSCGGGLKDWEDDDDPWEQHALWLSKCRYVKLIKGQSYIDAVKLRFKEKEKAADGQQQSTSNGADKPLQSDMNSTRSNETLRLCSSDENAARSSGVTRENEENEVSNNCVSSKCNSKEHCNQVAGKEDEKKSNSAVSEDKLCKICYANEYNTAFLGCGHVVACAKCASSVTKCPVCREQIKDIMRVYFP